MSYHLIIDHVNIKTLVLSHVTNVETKVKGHLKKDSSFFTLLLLAE